MKISAQEEYGLRILLRIATCKKTDGMSIPAIGQIEGITTHQAAKICRILRIAGYINSTRGHVGGYLLAKPTNEIILKDVLHSLGGSLFNKSFCDNYSGIVDLCTSSVDCSIRSLWAILQESIDGVLEKMTLQDLIGSEIEKQILKPTI